MAEALPAGNARAGFSSPATTRPITSFVRANERRRGRCVCPRKCCVERRPVVVVDRALTAIAVAGDISAGKRRALGLALRVLAATRLGAARYVAARCVAA